MSDYNTQTKKLVQKTLAFGKSKVNAKNEIRSVGTYRSYSQCIKQYLEWRHINRLPKHNQDSIIQLTNYLEEFAEWHQQKTLCQRHSVLT